ncbi:uncharacterized protein LOC130540691 isoform X1 [Pan paniscus]|uniref:uncharacterized protein LOC130540691 isoform X1 n=1 Tax=Pan paniscus TaxID=9597 RepID=UPI001561A6E3
MVLPAKSLKEPRELCENKADTGESSTGDGDRIPMIHLNTRTQERLWNGMTLQSCRLKVYFHLTLVIMFLISLGIRSQWREHLHGPFIADDHFLFSPPWPPGPSHHLHAPGYLP